MTNELIKNLMLDGVALWCDGEQLRLDAPRDGLDGARLDGIRAAKPAILAALKARGIVRKPQLLTPNQRAMWAASRYDPDNVSYNIDVHFTLDDRAGTVDQPLLQSVLRALLARHEHLNVTVSDVEGVPYLMPVPAGALQLEAATVAAAELDAALARHADVPLALGAGGTLRVRLYRVDDGRHVLQMVMHHIVVDFMSLGILAQELDLLYRSLAAGAALPAPAATRFSDYANFLAHYPRTPAGLRDAAYWQAQLEDSPAPLNLPTDRPYPQEPTGTGATFVFEIGRDTTAQIRRLAAQQNCTAYVVCLAAYAALLSRHTGEHDCIVGTPLVNRPAQEYERSIGYFSNTLPIRLRFGADTTGAELVGLVRGKVLEALEHQHFSLAHILESYKGQRDRRRTPVFQVAFAWEQFFSSARSAERGLIRSMDCQQRGAPYELALMMYDAGDTMQAHLQYQSDIFEAATISALAAGFRRIVGGLCADAAMPVATLPILDTATRAHLLQIGNNPGPAPARFTPAIARVAEQAAAHPQRIALAFRAERIDYATLCRRVGAKAGELRRAGVARGDVCAVIAPSGTARIVAVLAVMAAGAAFLPIAPDTPAERIRDILRLSGARLVLADDGAPLGVEPPAGVAILGLHDGAPASVEAAPWQAGPDDLAYVVFTSGSTGLPKGVKIANGALANLCDWTARQLDDGVAVTGMQLAGFGFDAFVWETVCFLANGATVRVADEEARVDPHAIARLMDEWSVTHAFVPTPLAEALGRTPLSAGALRKIFTGGAKLKTTGFLRQAAQVINMYGPSENTVIATAHAVGTDEDCADIPIGTPIDGVCALVLDARGEPVPPGVTGELYLGGRGLALGYVNAPDQEAAAFVANPFAAVPGPRLYRTGDLVKRDARGALRFVGRKDKQIKLSGYRIELGEIESALCRDADVIDAAVVFDEAERRLVAFVTGQVADAFALKSMLGRMLPSYMVPWRIFALPALPLTANGKVDRDALLRDVLPTCEAGTAATGLTATEQRLLDIWHRVLQSTYLRVTDHLFEIGGYSLMAIQVLSAIKADAGVEIGVKQFFSLTTVRDQAAYLEMVQRMSGLRAASLDAADDVEEGVL